MVLRRELRQELAGVIGIAYNSIEVDHAIKRTAGPNQFVYRLTPCLLCFRVIAGNIYASQA